MEVEPPAMIAVLGAGPIGLEAALYGRYLGYDVQVYERGHVAENVREWGHVRLFSPFGMNSSTLGRAALAAQDPQYEPPDDEAILTGREYADRYLLPLARSDLLAGRIHEECEVLSVARPQALKTELVGDPRRARGGFRLLLRGQRRERVARARVVLDTTGTYGQPNWLGSGGRPAIGERGAARHIERGLPDVLGADRARYAGRSVLVVGAGYSAATTVVALATLADEAPGTHVTWITRRSAGDNGAGPIALIPGDRLPERDRLARAANALAVGVSSSVSHRAGTWVSALCWRAAKDCFDIRLGGVSRESIRVERIVSQVGYRPDRRLHEELQVHECYASDGPMKLAAALLGASSADCLDQRSCGPQSLVTPEPGFFILGAKSYGRSSKFLISIGLEQVRDLFSMIGGRPALDLYRTARIST
jgi:thioredoxin reductase